MSKICCNFATKIIANMPVPRRIIFYNDYFVAFYTAQTEDVRRKINQVLKLVETQEKIPKKFFRSIETVEGLFEIRIEMESNIYRIFCCFDKGNLVVLFNGFQKKSQKTPPDQISRAERLKNEYFKEKEAR
jgi:phage-related protein